MTRVTRRYRFASSHRLHSDKLCAQENQEVYGKCNNPYGHGHNYVLDVTISGRVDERTGRLVNPGQLDSYVRDKILRVFDHRDMNRDIATFGERVPTAENIANVVGEMLGESWSDRFPGLRIVTLRIQETARNSVELRP